MELTAAKAAVKQKSNLSLRNRAVQCTPIKSLI